MSYPRYARQRVGGASLEVSDGCPLAASPICPQSTVTLKIFHHEFITIFRFLETRTVHITDISVVEMIDPNQMRYEEENDTVFLARDLMERLRNWSSQRMAPRIHRYQVGMTRRRM